MSAPTTFVDITTTEPRTAWTYLSEGGATMVFSYTGQPSDEFSGKVLRVRKSLRHGEDIHHHSGTRQKADYQSDDDSVAFQNIVSKLIRPQYLPVLQYVQVSQQWLKELAEASEAHRPSERIQTGGIDTERRNALLATDLIGKEGWAVEIKPKWGFLPSSKHLSPVTRPLKIRHCRFCMHSQLKGAEPNGPGATVAGYCPLDLYSGEEERVRFSLRCLWNMWTRTLGKANNLRIFNCGEIVDPADADSFAAFSNTLSDHYNSDYTLPNSDVATVFTEAVLPLILNHDILSVLGDLQRTLDSLDIEGLSKLWSVSRPGIPFGEGELDPTLAEWVEFVQAYLAGDVSTLRYEVLSYLLSATFKDCSLILRFPSQSKNGQKPDGTITVIDLDSKSASRLARWEALDLEIVKNFSEVSVQRKPCIDARHKS
ncbi:inositol-pentakisphosphate 2-kinase [Hysterangium stoloniferum]|nr:inositol-pentakisphosphate 2-kinase [Hysterangium stoloniferum]